MLKPEHKREVVDWSEDSTKKITIQKLCYVCQAETDITLDEAKYYRWQNIDHVQNVWPNWTGDQREMLISGTHSDCWKYLFPPDLEEDMEERVANIEETLEAHNLRLPEEGV